LTKLYRGILECEVRHARTTRLKITNRQAAPAVVLIRHTVQKGWTLGKGLAAAEKYGDAHLFRIDLPANGARTIEIEESTPMRRTIDLDLPVGMDLVRVYLEAPAGEGAFAESMQRLLKLHAEMANLEEAIENFRQRGDEYRIRLDELHSQIMSLQLVRTGG